MANILHIEGKLERFDPSTPWGFRMHGGKDFGSPLTIQKVADGSLAYKCGLREGDIILKIGDKSTDNLRHHDAQESIKTSGNHLDLLLQRGGNKPRYDAKEPPSVNIPSWQQQQHQPPSAASPSSNFNTAPKPFSTNQAPRSYSPVIGQSGGREDDQRNIKNLKNLNIASAPSDQPAYDKFAALDDRTALAAGGRNENYARPTNNDFQQKGGEGPTTRKYNSPANLYVSAQRNGNVR